MTIADLQAEEKRTYDFLYARGNRRCYECGNPADHAWRFYEARIGQWVSVLLCDDCYPECDCCLNPALFGSEYCIEHQEIAEEKAVA